MGGTEAKLVRTLYLTSKLDLLFCFALVHETGSCYGCRLPQAGNFCLCF